jgi:hypothetical protein
MTRAISKEQALLENIKALTPQQLMKQQNSGRDMLIVGWSLRRTATTPHRIIREKSIRTNLPIVNPIAITKRLLHLSCIKKGLKPLLHTSQA